MERIEEGIFRENSGGRRWRIEGKRKKQMGDIGIGKGEKDPKYQTEYQSMFSFLFCCELGCVFIYQIIINPFFK